MEGSTNLEEPICFLQFRRYNTKDGPGGVVGLLGHLGAGSRKGRKAQSGREMGEFTSESAASSGGPPRSPRVECRERIREQGENPRRSLISRDVVRTRVTGKTRTFEWER